MERVPFQANEADAVSERLRGLPVSVLLDNVRSLYNVGAFFRTADAAAIEKLFLCGITGRPPKHAISKTALGAEESVAWEHSWGAAVSGLRGLRARSRGDSAAPFRAVRYARSHTDAGRQALAQRGHGRRSGALRTAAQVPRTGGCATLKVGLSSSQAPDDFGFLSVASAGASRPVHPRSLPVLRRHADHSAAAGGMSGVLRRPAHGARSARGARERHRFA